MTLSANKPSTESVERPEIVYDDHLNYLDELRESGATNMFAAGPWLAEAYGLNLTDARIILGYWMKTFSSRRRGDARRDGHGNNT